MTNNPSFEFLPALFAALGIMGVYALGVLGFGNERRACGAALVLGTGALYAGMGKAVFADLAFMVFILYALLSFYLAFSNSSRKVVGILGFYFFTAFAVLAKGPLGLVIPMATVVLFLMYRRSMRFMADRWFFIGLLLCAALVLPWHEEFFYKGQWRSLIESGPAANDRWYFYPLTIFAGFFPWTLFIAAALAGLYRKLKWEAGEFEHFCLSWMLVVFVVFQSVHSKSAGHILPLFPALALLTGGFIDELLQEANKAMLRAGTGIMAATFFLLGIGTVAAYPFYRQYFPSMLPVYFLSAVLVVWGGGVAVFALREEYARALTFMGMVIIPLMAAQFFFMVPFN